MIAHPSDEAELAARLAWHMHQHRDLSPYSIAQLATQLCSLERSWRRHCVRCCNGEYDIRHDPKAEARADARIRAQVAAWCALVPGAVVELDGDPRYCVMRIRLPGMTEAVPV